MQGLSGVSAQRQFRHAEPVSRGIRRDLREKETLVCANTDTTISYIYDPFGNLKTTTDPLGNLTDLTYDVRGRKTKMIDRDMGTWQYEYDALGQLRKQCDPNGVPAGQTLCIEANKARMTYDVLGRMLTRTERDLTSTWFYDTQNGTQTGTTCGSGTVTSKGKLCKVSANNGYQRTHTYDVKGRPSSLTVTIDAVAYTTTTSYDAATGRVSGITYPTGQFAVGYTYNAGGYLSEVRRTSNNALLWRADLLSASGRVRQETLGNNLVTTRIYDALDRLTEIRSASGATNLYRHVYTYDLIGNLTQRFDSVLNQTENFTYDRLNRLTDVSGLVTRNIQYNAIGNMTYKSDAGSYTYPASGVASVRPHAVSSVTGAGANNTITGSYSYDANGNLASASGTLYTGGAAYAFSRALTYMSFNMPLMACEAKGTGAATSISGTSCTITGGAKQNSYTYTYSPDHERAKLVAVRSATETVTSIYIHPAGKGQLLYEKETNSATGEVENKFYIQAGAELVGVQVIKSTGLDETRYYHRDHLGSIAAISNPVGQVLERLTYEAYGERRQNTIDPQNSPQNRYSPLIGITTDRGFTAHEHLDEMNLIHMNGRIYDPALGRFMTADPFLQDPQDLQAYNRYSYALNNPLAYTDPSGYFSFKSFFKTVAIAAVVYFTAGAASGAMISSATSSFIAGTGELSTAFVTLGGTAGSLTALGTATSWAAGGFVGGLLSSGGDLGFAVKSGIAVGLTAGLGQYGMELAGTAGSIAGRSLGSGLSTQAFGGNFADGIKSGLLGAVRSEAYAYMQTETDKLATAWWGEGRMDRDEFGRPWTYGNRGCADGSGSNCATWFPERLLMPTEDRSWHTNLPVLGTRLGETPLIGAFANSVSKAHDWLNQVLTGVYETRASSLTYGAAREMSPLRGTVIDVISTAGMVPAAAFTARSLYNNPLRVSR